MTFWFSSSNKSLEYDAEQDGKIDDKMVEAWKWAQGLDDDMTLESSDCSMQSC
jgi:hypothetical protein